MATQADIFLREHASVHTRAVTPDCPFTIDHQLDGLSPDDLRLSPHGLNPIAWLLWHMARVEDGHVIGMVAGQPQVWHDPTADWPARLAVDRQDCGEGMTAAEVESLVSAINIDALREYRDAVGRRTRQWVAECGPDRMNSSLTAEDIQRAVAQQFISAEEAAGMTDALSGMPRDAALWWWGINHNFYHLGQIALVGGTIRRARGAGG